MQDGCRTVLQNGARDMAKVTREHLTLKMINAAKPAGSLYRLRDAVVPGLMLRVTPAGKKTWAITWGRGQERVIGTYPVMTLDGAREAARRELGEVAEHGAPLAVAKPKDRGTVADACRDYVEALRKEGREAAAADAERRFERCVYPDRIGKIRLADLHEDDVAAWRDRVEAGDLPDLPVKKGRPPEARPLSKSSANRIRAVLVAALNHAVRRRKVSPDRVIEWANVRPHRDATRRRELYLDVQQRRSLLEAADGPVRDLIECVALTGCRPGDPAACLREDYDARTGTVRFKTKGHDRKVPLSPAAKALFDRVSRGKLPKAHLFTQEGGRAWTAKDWSEAIRAAAAKAGLPSGVTMYTLRHCWITDAIVAGMDLLTVAKLSGTSLAMIEKHYGHLVHGAARDKLAAVDFL